MRIMATGKANDPLACPPCVPVCSVRAETTPLRGVRAGTQEGAELGRVVLPPEAVELIPPLQGVRWQLGGPETVGDRREITLDAAGSDVRGDDPLAILVGQ